MPYKIKVLLERYKEKHLHLPNAIFIPMCMMQAFLKEAKTSPYFALGDDGTYYFLVDIMTCLPMIPIVFITFSDEINVGMIGV